MQLEFGLAKQPNLKEFSHFLPGALQFYYTRFEEVLGAEGKEITFGTPAPFEQPDHRRYHAKTTVPVFYKGYPVPGTQFNVLLLGSNQGTGNTETYKHALQIPVALRADPLEGSIPRGKEANLAEFAMPLFSAAEHTGLYAVGSLLELTVNQPLAQPSPPDSVEVLQVLGDQRTYLNDVHNGCHRIPCIYTTLTRLEEGKRYGDPHAVLYSGAALASADQDLVQCVGFLDFTRPRIPSAEFDILYGCFGELAQATRDVEQTRRVARR